MNFSHTNDLGNTYWIFFILFTFLNSCFLHTETSYAIALKDVCQCYSESEILDMDERLQPCTSAFLNRVNQLDSQGDSPGGISEQVSSTIILELTKHCPSYRVSYIQTMEEKFTHDYDQAMDSLKKYEQVPQDSIPNRVHLMEYYFSVVKPKEALELIEEFLEEYPNGDYVYWLKAVVHNSLGEREQAIIALDSGMNRTKKEDFRSILQSLQNAIRPLKPMDDKKISINFRKEYF